MLRISPSVAAKVSLQPGDEHLRHEQDILALIDHVECPQLAQCFFRGIDVSFMELLANGTLHDRISINKARPVLNWMLQLTSAAAYLESLGYAHGDINPQNILLDEHDQVKLIDLDHSPKIGDALDVGYEPYVRQHREAVGGLFGVAGPVTEQFALGSVFWYMTRGSELYHDLEGHEQVDRLLDGQFPATNPSSPVDKIIANCWNGFYPRVADLWKAVKDLSGVDVQAKQTMAPSARRNEAPLCEKYYRLARSSLLEPS